MKKIKYHNYDIYEDGRVYSHFVNRFLLPDVTREGYLQVSLAIDQCKVRLKVHRLVAMLFKPNDNMDSLQVNHIDGNKANNHYTNLEWCTAYENNKHARETGLNNVSKSNSQRWNDPVFREKTSKKISETHIKKGISAHKKNPRFRYLIQDKNGVEYTRTELAQLLNYAQSTTDRWIKRVANGEPFKHTIAIEYGITVTDIKKDVSTIENNNKCNSSK